MVSILPVFFYLGQGTNGKGRKTNTVQVENIIFTSDLRVTCGCEVFISQPHVRLWGGILCRTHDGLGGVCNMNVCTVALRSVFPTHSDVKFSLGLPV
jgi:hypothetical protein